MLPETLESFHSINEHLFYNIIFKYKWWWMRTKKIYTKCDVSYLMKYQAGWGTASVTTVKKTINHQSISKCSISDTCTEPRTERSIRHHYICLLLRHDGHLLYRWSKEVNWTQPKQCNCHGNAWRKDLNRLIVPQQNYPTFRLFLICVFHTMLRKISWV